MNRPIANHPIAQQSLNHQSAIGNARARRGRTVVRSFAIWIFAWFGILFTIYLTFLEPFVIGATCAWCITSAVLMTLVFLAATGPVIEALKLPEDNDEEDNYDEDDTDTPLPELR